jgi:RecA/RadA recombinase
VTDLGHPPEVHARKAKLVKLSTLKPRPISWLLPGRVPFGAITLLAGRQGEGKSQFSIRLAADLSREGVPSIFIGDEDGAEDTVLPRLLAAGGTSELVSMFDMERDAMAQLPTDVPLLREKVLDTGAALVVVDPVQAHLAAEINPNADASLRQATRPLGRMAQELGIAVVMITHLRKSNDGGVLDRVGGSGGLVGACRSVLFFGHVKNTTSWTEMDVRYICHVKANGAQKARTLQCRIQGETVKIDGMSIPSSQLLLEEETDTVGPRDLE